MKLTRNPNDFRYFGDPECDRVAEIMLRIDDIADGEAFSASPSADPRNISIAIRYRIDGHAALNSYTLPRVLVSDRDLDIADLLREIGTEGAKTLHRQLAKYGGDINALRAAENAAYLAELSDD